MVMINWRRGQVIVTRNRVAQEGPLDEFLDGLAAHEPPADPRVPASRCSCAATSDTTPLALRARGRAHPHAPRKGRDRLRRHGQHPARRRRSTGARSKCIGHGLFKIVHLTARFGYHDELNIPEALALARKQGLLERNLDLEHASYFVSRITITPSDAPGMRRWRKKLFIAMARNASSAIDHFGLPGDRTVIMGSQVAL